MYDIYVRLIPLPYRIHAVTIPNEDATFDIYVNSQICAKKQKAALDHEIQHVRQNHFYDYEPVIINELEAG